MFHDEHGEFDLSLCLVCEEVAATATDSNIGGGVCLGCQGNLTKVEEVMRTVPGVGECAEVKRSRREWDSGLV